MPNLLSFLPLLLSVAIHLLMLKQAALLWKRTRLRWADALVFCLMITTLSICAMVLNQWAGRPLPSGMLILLGLLGQAGLGGWFLGQRALSREGAAVGFRGGATLALIAFALSCLIMIVGAVALTGWAVKSGGG